MKCPYCDSRVSPVPDNRVCPHCGGTLGGVERKKKFPFPKPPLGVNKGIWGCMQIEDQGIRFIKKPLFCEKTDSFILYEDILRVQFIPDTFWTMGLLSIRSKQDRELPFPSCLSDGISDSTSIGFYYDIDGKFRCAYEFLKQCAEIANKAREG